jgi:iron uptake system EfeUOB component EfeO/EfeM
MEKYAEQLNGDVLELQKRISELASRRQKWWAARPV